MTIRYKKHWLDGFSTFNNCCGPQMEKIKKRAYKKYFKNIDLDVIKESNMKIVNY